MKKIVLVYGLIAGAIVGGMMLITMPLYEKGTLDIKNGEIVGYTTMVVALSLIFFGVKSFRDQYAKGVITFGKGLRVGILITVVASVMYALAWEISFHRMSAAYVDKMGQEYVAKLKEKGTSDAEIQKMDEQFQVYKSNFPIRFGVTLIEIFPVGLIISLICAGLLRKKEFLTSQDNIDSKTD
jgi:hypothetical protein